MANVYMECLKLYHTYDLNPAQFSDRRNTMGTLGETGRVEIVLENTCVDAPELLSGTLPASSVESRLIVRGMQVGIGGCPEPDL
jgi:hypothetical protein